MYFITTQYIYASMTPIKMLELMGPGMLETTKIFFLTLLFSIPLGFLVTFGRMSRVKIIKAFFSAYISIMRGTPLMLQLFVVFYGPSVLFEFSIDRFLAVIIAFSLNYAAYFAEIYRSGIEAIPVGQYEAAGMLGYNKAQTFIKIILPQVIKIILPSVTNEVICLVKDTSLAFSIAYVEMFSIANKLVSAQTSLIPLVIAGIFFYIFNLLVALFMGWLEKKMDYYK